jgi:hypothetical protein
MKESYQDLAAAVKAIAGQLTDAVQLFQQGQSTVATGSNNNRGEDKKGLEEKETTGAATPARLNLKYIYGMGSSHLLTNAAAQAPSATTHTSPANEGGSGMSAADRLRQRLAQGQTQGSVGEITPTGDPLRAIREQYGKDDDLVSSGRVLAAGLRAATGYFGVQGHVNDLLSLGARDFIIMMMERKLLEQFQAGETTPAEDDIVIRMQGMQENGGIDAWSGRPPANGWPEDLFQQPAASIPNIIRTVKTINGIFRLLHSTLCNMNNGDALMAAMGVGDTTDKFISPGANVTIIEKLYNVALGSIDSTITFPGVVQELRDFWSNNAYASGDVPAEILQRMADQLAELGRKVQLIGDLGTNAVEPMTGRVIPIERKTELLTDPQDMVTWLSYAKSVAMAENNGIYSTTVVDVIDQLATRKGSTGYLRTDNGVYTARAIVPEYSVDGSIRPEQDAEGGENNQVRQTGGPIWERWPTGKRWKKGPRSRE